MEYFEDIPVGHTDSFGSYEVTEAEIIEFAEQYDPQPFHVDPEAAAESWFGGLVASGWHTASMTMRMLVDNQISESGIMGAAGVEDLQWRKPVRPGDTLHVETEVASKDSWHQPGVGLMRTDTETINQDDEVVMTMTSRVLVQKREMD